MATIYQNPSVAGDAKANGEGCSHGAADPARGYDGYVEPDTKVPSKARPVMHEISVNGVDIAEGDVLKEAQQHPAKNPGEALTAAAKALVVRELLLQEAKRLMVTATPETDEDGKTETLDDAKIRCLISQEVTTPEITEEECLRYYSNNETRFRSETIYEVRHILLAAPEKDKAARNRAKAEAEILLKGILEKPQSFKGKAKEFSDCPSKEHGGNLGQITRGATVKEFEMALEKMQAGSIAPAPVESRFGFHLIALDHKVPGDVLPFDYVKERIAAWLEASSWSRAVSQYIGILAGEATITGINLDAADSPLVQ